MDRVARRSSKDRAALFNTTSERMGIASSVIPEKDFWVCWTLSKLFVLERVPSLLFKGGTSLSKAFGLIDRFSEDIDLSFNREELGFAGADDPAQIETRKARNRQIEALGKACVQRVQETLLPKLDAVFASILEQSYRIEPVARDDGQLDLLFHYPRALEPSEYGTYVEPFVRLEIGARSDHEPTQRVPVQSYAAQHVPSFFEKPACEVVVLAPERTFWEKATIFHAENHRPLGPESTPPGAWSRMSRHAYDLAALDRAGIGARALDRLDLLDAVARHKHTFFFSGWARYEEARPGSFVLAPNPQLEESLRRDYAQMAPMFLKTPPAFEELVESLRDLERRINANTRT